MVNALGWSGVINGVLEGLIFEIMLFIIFINDIEV